MSKHLEFKRSSANDDLLVEQVIFKPNGKNIGEVFRDVDGEHYFQPTTGGGAWAGYVLVEIGIHLSLLNGQLTADRVLQDIKNTKEPR